MYPRLLHQPLKQKKSFFLFGPRGTGKTVWIKKNIEHQIYIDLLDSKEYLSLLNDPNLEERIPLGYEGWIVIDEVQKVPRLLDEVHRLIENHGYRFVLTGSSARSLRRQGVNLLAGRARVYRMHPLTSQELQADFSLDHALRYGGLPETYTDENPQKYLSDYAQTYLREEVLQEGLVRDYPAFARFLEVASFSQGSVLNMSQVARETHVSRATVEGYFHILEDLLLAHRLPAFSKRAKRRLISHPKFYYFDVGVYRTLRPKGPLDRSEEIDGAALETLLFQELRAINDYYDYEYQLYYWRTAQQVEVDFVLYGSHGLIAIEVKRSKNPSPKDLRGLKAFQSDYPEAQLFLFYLGHAVKKVGGITLVPLAEALGHLPNMLKEPSALQIL